MGFLDKLNDKDWSPISDQLDRKELKILLSKPKHKKLFCWHNWIYWTYGSATRLHRVCDKCYKKEKNTDVLNTYNKWINE